LEKFEVNPMFIPTVIFYLPEKDKSAHLIGKFDYDTIKNHEQKFVSGKLATFPMKTKAQDLEIKDLDCPNLQINLGAEATNSELEDEILKEILEEEKKRQEELNAKKKKGSKKKKGGKKNPRNEDL